MLKVHIKIIDVNNCNRESVVVLVLGELQYILTTAHSELRAGINI